MEFRFTFRAEVYIKAGSKEEARQKFDSMSLLSAEALDHYGDVCETYEEEIWDEN